MITTIMNREQVIVPVEEFLKQLELMNESVHLSVYPTFWCDGKELNIEAILSSLKFR